jgi:hypothetical protein
MHPAERLLEQLKAGRSATDRTAKKEKCERDRFGDELPFIIFESAEGDLIGWLAVEAKAADVVELRWIEARENGTEKGGDLMLKQLCGLADNLGVAVTLQAAPWDERKLEELIDWYEANGFVLDAPPRNQTRYQRMTRMPRAVRRTINSSRIFNLALSSLTDPRAVFRPSQSSTNSAASGSWRSMATKQSDGGLHRMRRGAVTGASESTASSPSASSSEPKKSACGSRSARPRAE